MPAARPAAAPREMSYLRIVAQGFVPATTAPDAVEAVRRLLAVQGQQVSAVAHALVVRAEDAGGPDVDAAFETGRLVRSWPMRGTAHITTAADHHWLRVALMHRTDAWTRSSEQRLGIDDSVLARAADTALGLVAERGPVTRAALVSAWVDAGLIPATEAAGSLATGAGRRRHLIVRLHREGVLAQGPRRGNEHLVVDARSLPGAQTGPGGTGGGARGTGGHRAALAEIARRYATSHGPVSAADLARWTTLPVRECLQALEDAVEVTTAAGYQVDLATARVPLARATVRGGLRGAVDVLGAQGVVGRQGRASQDSSSSVAPSDRARVRYLRADLPELLASSRRAAGRTLFLPSFDELHVGYKDRLCLTDAAGEALICPASNGMFRPLLVDRGRLVAVRPVSEGLLWLGGQAPSARLEHDVERVVGHVQRRLAQV
ncbi:winged helix DNA-binding domain-containing protein [Actinomyces lilanjuaniae]|uniref:Winged helix DNA-binding domain-containing protein n=1 Tax=Actinomyces lilanjuaniae TaxID=2321394 RepID=A0ABM6Z4H9_9ACTO|nr:crosslink repair DNA glycosylase YcaQ family protein [Actinomyces lilanjuaniae]AYD90177.1 winged helix DNA-binding domain-containing protein [Actinomyces lilanjuaniae]